MGVLSFILIYYVVLAIVVIISFRFLNSLIKKKKNPILGETATRQELSHFIYRQITVQRKDTL